MDHTQLELVQLEEEIDAVLSGKKHVPDNEMEGYLLQTRAKLDYLNQRQKDSGYGVQYSAMEEEKKLFAAGRVRRGMAVGEQPEYNFKEVFWNLNPEIESEEEEDEEDPY